MAMPIHTRGRFSDSTRLARRVCSASCGTARDASLVWLAHGKHNRHGHQRPYHGDDRIPPAPGYPRPQGSGEQLRAQRGPYPEEEMNAAHDARAVVRRHKDVDARIDAAHANARHKSGGNHARPTGRQAMAQQTYEGDYTAQREGRLDANACVEPPTLGA